MSFDKPTRNALSAMVVACRNALAKDVQEQLQSIYGLHPDGTLLDVERLVHLSADQREEALQLREYLGHVEAAGPGGAGRYAAAYDRMVREIGFTVLNRLAALRMCEERGHIIECVRRGMESDGFRMYEMLAKGTLGNRYQTYRFFIKLMFREMAVDLGALFDQSTPLSIIFPTEQCFDQVLEQMNKPAIAELWAEDETIGWVYQYFNPKEEREAMRKASSAPRNSRELAVRNQFFTPRYVVEFLTDNTLGRTWYEMRKGDTRLVDECRYMVIRKHPFFLEPGEAPPEPYTSEMQIGGDPDLAGEMWVRPNPEAEDVGDIFSYALTVGYPAFGPGGTEAVSRVCEPVRQRREETGKWQGSFEQLRACLFFEQRRYHHFGNEPDGEALEVIKRLHKALCEQWDLETEFIPHRAKKDPRDLKILDPACGSGHFLLYAFDLLETIYEEAWEDEDVPPFTETSSRLRDDYATIEDMRVALPDLILRHNLHGIDIDPRACQIAALALWLRAQRSYQRLGLKGADRPQITKTNIVVAEPMPGERDMLHEFCAGLRWNTLANIVRAVFEKMKLAGEAGSLLKIEEDIRDLIKLAQQERRAEIERARDKKGNDLLFTQSDMDKIAGEKQQRLFDATDMTDEELWQEMESHVLSALERYAEKATNGHTASRRLFAEDAERGFAFIELCVQWYDVALMNPPFGEPASASKPYITRCYARSKHDLACGFVDRWIARCLHQGRLGAITTRTVFFLSSSARWREETMLKENHVDVFADLGYGVLDAMVETAAYCLVSGQLQRG